MVNPDIERGAQEFTKWAKVVLGQGMRGDANAAELLAKLGVLPTDAAVPYNATHRMIVDQIAHRMRQSADDAFRLQYFAKERSWIERSINHPFFGLYPASYMYGKILPELVRFIAREPFGIQTGAMAESLYHLQMSLATQRELDGEFNKLFEGASKSETAWLFGYMIPSVPWDIGAALPAWARSFARQGLENQKRADAGLPPNPIDFDAPVRAVGAAINPLRPYEQLGRTVGEISGALGIGENPQPAAPPAKTGLPTQAINPYAPLQAGLGDAAADLTQLFTGQ
jgi:hypothetical protein